MKFWMLGFLLVALSNRVKCSSKNESYSDSDGIFNIVEDEASNNDLSTRTFSENIVKENLVFHYFKNGVKLMEDKGLEANLSDSGCLPSDKFAFLIHGWGESCQTKWVPQLIDKLTIHRGGCIVCVDYGVYKKDPYLRLLAFFAPMTNVLINKLKQLKTQGLDPRNTFIFGFSLGGQMASSIGRQMGPPLFKQIDACDMAGPGFDFRRVVDHRLAADQVNCWHTSRNKGTRFYSCHQNVRFGNCGHNQPGESAQTSSHGLCLKYYINSFDYPFYVALPPNGCRSRHPATFIPQNYTVGYNEDSRTTLAGEVFVPTSDQFPYNLSLEKLWQLNSITLGINVIESTPRPRRRLPVLIQHARNRLRERIRS